MSTPNYLSVASLQAAKGPGGEAISLSNYSDPELEAMINLAETLVEQVTNNIFYPLTATYFFDGSGRPVLFFPPMVNYPLVSITGVWEVDDDGTTVLDSYTEDDDYKRYAHYLEFFQEADTVRKRVIRGEWWPRGSKNIKVTGVWGAATVPPEIAHAVKLLVLHEAAPGALNTTPSGVQHITWPDFSVRFVEPRRGGNPTSVGQAGASTGIVEVDRILSRYVNYADLFMTTEPEPRWREI
jgi:hypothetical protein